MAIVSHLVVPEGKGSFLLNFRIFLFLVSNFFVSIFPKSDTIKQTSQVNYVLKILETSEKLYF